MALISKAFLVATGYVLGARAGTGRYLQIVAAARTLADRLELQPYLAGRTGRTPAAPPAPGAHSTHSTHSTLATAPGTELSSTATTAGAAPGLPPLVEPALAPAAARVTVTELGTGRRRPAS